MGSSVFALMLFFLVLSMWNAPLAHAASIKVIDLGYARFESDLSLVDGVTSFLGLRYAAPPTGNLSVVSCHRIVRNDVSLQESCDGKRLSHQPIYLAFRMRPSNHLNASSLSHSGSRVSLPPVPSEQDLWKSGVQRKLFPMRIACS